MQDRSVPVIRAEIWLRLDQFELMTELLGCSTYMERAELIDISERQLRRARTGRVGDVLVANTLAGLGRHEQELRRHQLRPNFESLFEIRERAA
jgi:hypothetical protein